jgi:hypothetical protein
MTFGDITLGGGGDWYPRHGELPALEGPGWICCPSKGECVNPPSMCPDEIRTAIWATKEACEAASSEGNNICRRGDPRKPKPKPKPLVPPPPTTPVSPTPGPRGWGSNPFGVPNGPEPDRSPGSTHTGGGYTPGGRPMNGLPHGTTTDHKNSEDSNNLYKCVGFEWPTDADPDNWVPGICMPCSSQDEQENLCDVLELCRETCEIAPDGPTGYRCTLLVEQVGSDFKETAHCDMVMFDHLIEYSTLEQCHAQCTGPVTEGYDCVEQLHGTPGNMESRYTCAYMAEGQYSTAQECWDHCMDDGPWTP